MLTALHIANIPTHPHPDMGTFVGAVMAILLCSTLWDIPKKILIEQLERRGKSFIRESKNKLLEIDASASSLLEQLEDIEEDFADSCRKVKNLINWCYSRIYVPSAIISGTLALVELFLGGTQTIGYWNALLLTPILLFLAPCIVYIFIIWIILLIERWSFKRRLKRKTPTKPSIESAILDFINKTKN